MPDAVPDQVEALGARLAALEAQLAAERADRQVAESGLREVLALIEGITAGTDDLIAAQDPGFHYTYFNAAYQQEFQRLWGRPLTVGTSMIEALAPWPDQQTNARALWARAHAGETFHVEMAFGRTEAERRIYDLRFTPVRDRQGRLTGAAHVLRDVTERARVQAALAASEERLRAAARQKDTFIAVLAHELRNPLAPIRTSAALLRTRDDELVARCREVIERQVSQMGRLLDDLLDISRLSRGTLRLQMAPVALHDVLEAAIEQARPALDERRHVLAVGPVAPTLRLDADAGRLTQVFGNLLANAARYTPAGGHVSISVAESEGDVAVTVRDSGIGIAPDMLEAVFDLFAQVDEASDAGRQGLGIGLALARQLLTLHGGTITAASGGAGRGAAFTVRLPLAPVRPTVPAARPGTHGDAPWWAGRRVLVADDNHDGAEMLALLLSAHGADVRVVHDGEAAVREAVAFRPHVALLDVGMPRVDGLEACRRIRADLREDAPRLVAVTGWSQAEDRQQTEHAGFDAHVVKPVDLDVLLAAIAATPR